MTVRIRVRVPDVGTISFTDDDIDLAIRIVDASGIPDRYTPLLPTGGRPSEISLRGLVVGFVLTLQTREGMFLDVVAPILNGLPLRYRRELGLVRPGNKPTTTRQVETAINNLAKAVDPSPNYHGKGLTAEQRAVKEALLQEFANRLVDATAALFDGFAGRDVAYDATIVHANSRPERTKQRKAIRAALAKLRKAGGDVDLADVLTSDRELGKLLGIDTWGADPIEDAAAVKQIKAATRRASDRDAATLLHKGELKHSYAIHTATTIPTEAQVQTNLAYDREVDAAKAERRDVRLPVPDPVPCFIPQFSVTAATAEPGPVAVRDLTDYSARRRAADPVWTPGDMVADMGYTNDQPQDFHQPLRADGWRLVFDLPTQLRTRFNADAGIVGFAGCGFCPAVTRSFDLPWDRADGKAILPRMRVGSTLEQWAERWALVETLAKFRVKNNGKPDPLDGRPRKVCPSQRNRNPEVGCGTRKTLDLVISRNLPEVIDPPTETPLPPICSRTAVRVGADVFGREQDLMLDSRPWYDSFHRRRPRVEGTNGIMKNPALGHIGKMRFRVRGIAKVTLLITFLIAAVNIRQWRLWEAQKAEVAKKNAALLDAPRRRRRAKKSPTRADVLAAAGTTPPAHQPPDPPDTGPPPRE